MFKALANIFRVADLRRKILFTLLMLVVYRMGTFIPVPGQDSDVLSFQDEASAFGFLDTFGGGALGNFSIFAMGVFPYITASIVVQLLRMDVVPKFTEWSKQGEAGRRKLAQFTRYFTVVLAFVQALAMSIGFNTQFPGLIPDPSITTYLMIALIMTAGTTFLMWLGEQITAQGVGNGISILIFSGIAAGIPNGVNMIYATQIQDQGDQMFMGIVTILLLALAFYSLSVGVVFVQQAIRKVPIQYAKRVVGQGNTAGAQSTHLPLKVNSAGVIPVIFAMALFIFPPTVAGFFCRQQWCCTMGRKLQLPNWLIFYVGLIIAFTYFYTFVQVNPETMAENLKKQGGYIPGVRPGKATELTIRRILYRLTFVGALFLATVSIIPIFFTNQLGLPQQIQIGGTGLLIVVGVALDTMKQIEGQLIKRSYKGFIK
ncbi:LOW QUALITY PROTEIN: preprotein translocase SecY subunit [Geomicrobium sp. JCM 19055]|nr:LOW QUALITY PROTEIN: preprotein translocase SecY subunit [Geomicrobium sp. JCM 19055]